MSDYNAAYINALSEERNPKILFDWVVTLHKEGVDLRGKCMELELKLKIAIAALEEKEASV